MRFSSSAAICPITTTPMKIEANATSWRHVSSSTANAMSSASSP